MGQFVLLWMSGDPAGFGSLAVNQIANAAGGIPAPVAPGEVLSLFGQQIGYVEGGGDRGAEYGGDDLAE